MYIYLLLSRRDLKRIVAVDKKSASAIPERSIIDEKSDIYSVGATFYHLITGEKLKRQRDGYEETRLVNAVGEAFAGVILKAVNPDRKKRFANVYEMYLAYLRNESGRFTY